MNFSPTLIALEASETAYYARDVYVVLVANILDDVMQGSLDTFHPRSCGKSRTLSRDLRTIRSPVFDALGNNFRHYPEWAKATEPTSEQLRSLKPLMDVIETTMFEGGIQRSAASWHGLS